MIDLSQEEILVLMICSAASGILIGVLYELVRVLRLMISPCNGDGRAFLSRLRRAADTVLTFLTDLAFCLLSAAVSLLLTYNISGGVFRGCVYLCMGLGWLLYRLTVGKLAYKLEKRLTALLKRILRFILKPIMALFSLINRFYALTIGKKLCKIKCRIIEGLVKKQKKENTEEIKEAESEPSPKEEDNNADKGYGYRKECRRSFCAKRAEERRGDLGEKS